MPEPDSIREKVLSFIENNPGVHFREIQRQTGTAVGQLEYHLYSLEKEGVIKGRKDGKFVRFFSLSASALQNNIFFYLRSNTLQDMFESGQINFGFNLSGSSSMIFQDPYLATDGIGITTLPPSTITLAAINFLLEHAELLAGGAAIGSVLIAIPYFAYRGKEIMFQILRGDIREDTLYPKNERKREEALAILAELESAGIVSKSSDSGKTVYSLRKREDIIGILLKFRESFVDYAANNLINLFK